MRNIKRILGVTLAGALMACQVPFISVGAVANLGPAINAIKCTDAAITFDDSTKTEDDSACLSEWTNVPKTYFNGSTDEYFQVMWSENRLYFAVTATDSTKSIDGIIRDHIRVAVKLPGQTDLVSLFYGDCDNWYQGNATATSWWGESGTSNVAAVNNTCTKFVYAAGKVYVEGSLNLYEASESIDYRSYLTKDAKIGLSIKYYDQQACNSNTVTNHFAMWGDTNHVFTDDTSTFGTVTLTEPLPGVFATGGTAVALSNTDSIAVDGSVVEWGNVAKNYMASSDASGTYSLSTEEYFQVMWSANRLYFAMVVNDDEKTVNDLNRDHVRVAVKLPGNIISTFYSDCDNWHQWNNTDVAGWWGELNTTTVFQQDSSFTQMVYSNGKVYIEGSMNFADEYKSYLTKDAQIGFAIRYYDNQKCNASGGGDHCAMWGDNDQTFTNDTSLFGTITLSAQSGVTTPGDDGEYHSPLGVYVTDIEKGTATIDGKEDVVWKNVEYSDRLIANNFQHEPSGWGPTDTTGKMKMMWDEKGIYFWVEVTDSTHNMSSESGQISDKDSIILYIDQINDDGGPYGAESGTKTGISPWLIGASGECYGSGNGMMQGATFSSNVSETATGYIYEVFIGWTISETAAVDKYIGVDVDINDNINGKKRDAVVFWNTLSIASGNWNLTNGYADGHLIDTGLSSAPEIVDATDNALTVETPVNLPDGVSKKLTWSAVSGAYEYQINLFSVSAFDSSELFYEKTYKVYGDSTYSITDLLLETDYVYQILAYSDDGTLLSVSETGKLSTITDFGGGDTSNPVSSQPDTNSNTNSDTETSNVPTGVGLPMGIIGIAVIAFAGMVIARRKIR